MSYQGTFDEHWKTQRLPYWPEDFDYRFHHSAPADLVAPDYLRSDEMMILTHCLGNPPKKNQGGRLSTMEEAADAVVASG